MTEVIKAKPNFQINGYKAMFQKGLRRLSVTKINRHSPFPRNFRSYAGIIELYIPYHKVEELDQKISDLIAIDRIGLFKSEGYGNLRWLGGRQSSTGPPKRGFKVKHRIRKELSWQLPPHVRDLIRYAILHDFVHTEKHPSKIYSEVVVSEAYKEYLRDHHLNTRHSAFISTFQYYDRKAAGATRHHKSPRSDRYNWKWFNNSEKYKSKQINFEQLAFDIGQIAHDVTQLYAFVYKNEQLGFLVESMDYGHSSLREHLLLIANMMMTDFFREPQRFDRLKTETLPPIYGESTD